MTTTVENNLDNGDFESINEDFSSSGTPIKDNTTSCCDDCNKTFKNEKERELHMIVGHKKKISEKDTFKKEISKIKPKVVNNDSKTITNFRKTFDDNCEECDLKKEKKNGFFKNLKHKLSPYSSSSITYQSNLRYNYYLSSSNSNYPPQSQSSRKNVGAFSV